MPNWCYTSYIIHGSKQDIDIFYNVLVNARKNNHPNGFGESWLGNVIHEIGLGNKINHDESVHCRGSFELPYNDEYLDDCLLHIDTETAWGPLPNVWDRVIEEKKLSSITYSYESEEPGMCDFIIHNAPGYEDFNDEVYLDAMTFVSKNDSQYNPDIDDKIEHIGEYRYTTKEHAIKLLNDLFGTSHENISDFKKLIRDFNETNQNEHNTYCYVYVHEFEYV